MIESILWVLFVLASLVASFVILLQEPKGGGLGEAFGGAAAQSFGVKTEGITRFTAYLAGGIIVLAIVITRMRSNDTAVASLNIPSPSDSPVSSTDIGTGADTGAGTGTGDTGDGDGN